MELDEYTAGLLLFWPHFVALAVLIVLGSRPRSGQRVLLILSVALWLVTVAIYTFGYGWLRTYYLSMFLLDLLALLLSTAAPIAVTVFCLLIVRRFTARVVVRAVVSAIAGYLALYYLPLYVIFLACTFSGDCI
jgi:hypothetical protein